MLVGDLIKLSRLKTPEDIATFHHLRKEAFQRTLDIFEDRSRSYNVDSTPIDEFPFGVVSLASEMFKRAKRACSVVTPLRTEPMTEADLDRLEDTCLDQMNFASWQWALVQIARSRQHDGE